MSVAGDGRIGPAKTARGAAAVGASISSALGSSLGERGGEDTDEADPGLGDEDPEGDASEAGKHFVTVTSCTGALASVRTALWSCSAARIRLPSSSR